MADLLTQTQDPMPVLQDDLLKDRIRQFTEFLDDEASPSSVARRGHLVELRLIWSQPHCCKLRSILLWSCLPVDSHKRLTTIVI